MSELQVWAHELRDHFGVTHVIYHTATLKCEQVGAFTYSLEWARHYIEQDYSEHRPGGARRAAALSSDGLEDARLVEPAGAGR